jgi:hypothetical protein
MINTDRIVPIQAIDLISMYGLILLQNSNNSSLAALDAIDPGVFEVASGAGSLLLADEPVETLDFATGYTAGTVYFVPAFDYSGFTINGSAVTPEEDSDEVNPDGRTLYKAVLASGEVTITQVGF